MRIGIDLGTTNTVVSYITDEWEWKLLEFTESGRNEDKYLLPSAIANIDGKIVVGQKALDYEKKHPECFMSNKKRFMGQRYNNFFAGRNFGPEDIAKEILREVRKQLGHTFQNEKEFKAFITVPAGFDMHARQATKTSLVESGFKIDESCLTDEPISAAVAYSEKIEKDRYVLVVDIGGGTFDLAVLRTSAISDSSITDKLIPIATGCDMSQGYELGGDYIDAIILKDMVKKLNDTNAFARNVEVDAVTERDRYIIAELKSHILGIKKGLYSDKRAGRTAIKTNDYRLNYELLETDYMKMMKNIAEGFNAVIDNTFVGRGITAGDIDHVLVVGGMSREICLNSILRSKFGEDRIIVPENGMYLVSKGAAICNNDAHVHVESIANSSIGMLINRGCGVETFIHENEKLKDVQRKRFRHKIAEASASAVNVIIVEYRGKFDPDRCIRIFEETLLLNIKQNRLLNVFRKDKRPELKFEMNIGEDKILEVYVDVGNGKKEKLEFRMKE